jgi:farnesyl diphosphate synthase
MQKPSDWHFQIVDDVLDATADSQTLGKTAGKDAAANKPTYVTLGLDYAQKQAKELQRGGDRQH